jgi:cytochrome oxidase Cu insertion factor (SCO1/SenC/PrrC family)
MRRLAQAFGLDYQEQDNQISHTMNIALIAPDGTLVKSWSTEWTSDELLKALRQAAHRSAKG